MSEAFGSSAEYNFPEFDPALTLEEQARLQLLDAQSDFLKSAVHLASHRAEPITQLRLDGNNMYLRLRETMGHMTKKHTSVVPIGAAASLLARLDEGQVSYYESIRPTELSGKPLHEDEAQKRIVHTAGSMDMSIQDATLRLYARQTHFNLRYLFGFTFDD